MKVFFPAWILSALIVFLGCSLIGYFSDLNLERKLSERDTLIALEAVFPGQEPWTGVSGGVSRGWLKRVAWISGESRGQHFSEQVVKVGWPFTASRGFIRLRAGTPESEGAALLEGKPQTGMVRFMPVQPVWPGILINSLPLALLLVLGWRRSHI